jgi:transposase
MSSISLISRDDRGQPPYNPKMMTKILVYSYCTGIFSSRKIQKRLIEDVAFWVLAVQRLLKHAKAADDEEDSRYGKDRAGDELPEELRGREIRLQKIKEAKRALEQRAREEAKKSDKTEAPEEKVVPADKAQYIFTDPESRIIKGADGFVQAYNVQVVVEESCQLIVAIPLRKKQMTRNKRFQWWNWSMNSRDKFPLNC